MGQAHHKHAHKAKKGGGIAKAMPKKTERFNFILSVREREALRLVAQYEHRGEGDTLRMLIRQAADDLDVWEDTANLEEGKE